jgi:hypothetical protein
MSSHPQKYFYFFCLCGEYHLKMRPQYRAAKRLAAKCRKEKDN